MSQHTIRKSITNRYLKQNSSLDTSSQPTPPKQLRCNSLFNFIEHWFDLICGDLCLEKSTKNPGRHKKGSTVPNYSNCK